MSLIKSYLSISRPANVITSVADVLAGIIISLSVSSIEISYLNVIFLILSTMGLYAGGIVFNDIFDYETDKKERPERILPSGKISFRNAVIFGSILLILGVTFGTLTSSISGLIAFFIAFLALLYNKFSKHNKVLGPINMGLCRGFNLLLGISFVNHLVFELYWICVIPIFYIAAITVISRSEVFGGNRPALIASGLLFLLVSITQLSISFIEGNILITMPFVMLHLLTVFSPLLKAIKDPIPSKIIKTVKTGVISMIIMDSAWAVVFGNLIAAIIILLLLPVSIRLAKYFAVT